MRASTTIGTSPDKKRGIISEKNIRVLRKGTNKEKKPNYIVPVGQAKARVGWEDAAIIVELDDPDDEESNGSIKHCGIFYTQSGLSLITRVNQNHVSPYQKWGYEFILVQWRTKDPELTFESAKAEILAQSQGEVLAVLPPYSDLTAAKDGVTKAVLSWTGREFHLD